MKLCKGDMEHINNQCKFKHSFYSTFSFSMWAVSRFFATASIAFPKKDKFDIGLYDSTFC